MQDKPSFTVEQLLQFESSLVREWEAGKIRVPVHFSGGNEQQLINIFKEVKDGDWVISTHRNHYHAVLHGISPASLCECIRGSSSGGSMVQISSRARFISTGIVGGGCGIAVGLAWAIKERGGKVWCFIGDGATDEGHFYEAWRYAVGWDLPIEFVIEDNDRATETSNEERWGKEGTTYKVWKGAPKTRYYAYEPTFCHVGTKKYVQF